jgi:hypothetical protein
MNQDGEHLRLLSIFHYVVAGMVALFSLFPVIHRVIGIMRVTVPGHLGPGAPPPPFVGWLFIVFAVLFILCGEAMAVLILLTARFLSRRKHHLFCLVIAGIECLWMPFGTVLGVFTLIVLLRESVKDLFHHQGGVEPLA